LLLQHARSPKCHRFLTKRIRLKASKLTDAQKAFIIKQGEDGGRLRNLPEGEAFLNCPRS
jgi:hypothetical protein